VFLCLLPLRTADCPSAASWSLKQHIYLCINDITSEQKGIEKKRDRAKGIEEEIKTVWIQSGVCLAEVTLPEDKREV